MAKIIKENKSLNNNKPKNKDNVLLSIKNASYQ